MNTANTEIHRRASVNWNGNGRFLFFMVALVLVVLLGTANQPQLTNVQPALLAVTAEQPETAVRVIIQKSDPTADIDSTITQLGGSVIKDLHIINALVAQIPASLVPQLAQSSGVRWVSLDGPVASTGKPPKDPAPEEPGYTNYFLDTLGVRPVWDMGLDGSGITVAVIDSGIAPDQDFRMVRRSISFNPNSVSTSDVYGHGTHVAGIIAGNGTNSNGLYRGIAPGVELINLKISDAIGMSYESDTVEAMQWVLDNKDAYNIRVVNLSIQSTVEQSYHTSPLDAAAEILWFNGVVVVSAAGNWPDGAFNPIHAAPANDPFIITVGASDEKGTVVTRDDVIAPYSAYDETQEFIIKPEIIAPGSNIVSVLAKQSDWAINHPDRVILNGEYFRLSGTSMAAPMVTGAVALLLQDEPNLTPDQVKYRLLATAGKIGKSPNYLNVYAAVTGTTTASSNTGFEASQLLWTGSDPINWDSVNWGSVNWGSVNWGSVNWGSVNWGSVNWGSVDWNN
ncbi:MAG: S8 family serine peptidase [Anaerolineae bacterium]|jgi:serine protease AprX